VPPHLIDSVPSRAPASPPLTGASSMAIDASAARWCSSRDTSGLIVLISSSSVPGAASARTPSPPV
jgi:hypothetical protein